MSENGPSVRFRRIGRTLRELREDANRSLRTAGRHLDRSPSNLSMIENGLQPIRPRSLAHILDYYGVRDGPLRDSLLHLAAQGRESDWTRAYEGRVSAASLDIASLERDSELLRSFQPGRMPGLTQTEDYTHGVMAAAPSGSPRDDEGLVAFRMSRQRILNDPAPPRFEALIGEAALHQQVGGPRVMAAQLARLIAFAQRDHVAIRVLPFSVGAFACFTTPFDIFMLRPPGQLTVVVVSDLTQVSFRERDEEVATYQGFFNHVWGLALDESHSLAHIERIASQL